MEATVSVVLFDRNKTALTHEVTEAAHAYLDQRGCKPLETEVWMGGKWIADLGGVLCPTQTELIDLRLLPRRPTGKAPVEKRHAWHDLYMPLIRLFTVLVEVKTARGDFRSDDKWKRDLPADLAYLAYPKGMIVQHEWPDGWGILQYDDATKWVKCLRPPTVRTTDIQQQLKVVLQTALRCDHRVRYAGDRETQKHWRSETNELVNRERLQKSMRAVTAIAHGRYESVAGVLQQYGIKNLTPDDIQHLEKLWNIKGPHCQEAGS
jgi:hypothetical protein